jgi:hypothetical protein
VYDLQFGSYVNMTHVGRFGNASVLNLKEWLPLLNPPAAIINDIQNRLSGSPTTPTIQDSTSPAVCPFVLTSLHLAVFTSPVGLKTNPQMEIIGARFEYQTSQVRVSCFPNGGTCTATDVSTKLPVFLESSVVFIETQSTQLDNLNQVSYFDYVPPPPTILPMLPQDFFYPFMLNNAARTASFSMYSVSIPLLAFCYSQPWH